MKEVRSTTVRKLSILVTHPSHELPRLASIWVTQWSALCPRSAEFVFFYSDQTNLFCVWLGGEVEMNVEGWRMEQRVWLLLISTFWSTHAKRKGKASDFTSNQTLHRNKRHDKFYIQGISLLGCSYFLYDGISYKYIYTMYQIPTI